MTTIARYDLREDRHGSTVFDIWTGEQVVYRERRRPAWTSRTPTSLPRL